MRAYVQTLLGLALENYKQAEQDLSMSYEQKQSSKKEIESQIFSAVSGGHILQSLFIKRIRRENKSFWCSQSEVINPVADWSFLREEALNLIIKPIIDITPEQNRLILDVIDKFYNHQVQRSPIYFLQVYIQELTQAFWHLDKATSRDDIVRCYSRANELIYLLWERAKTSHELNDRRRIGWACYEYLEELRQYVALKDLKITLLDTLKLTPEEYVNAMKMGSYAYRELEAKNKGK